MAQISYHGHTNVNLISDKEDDDLVSDDLSTIPTKSWNEPPPNRRSELLAYLRNTVRENGDFIHFPNKTTLFKELYHILGDGSWQVRSECLQLITELIPLCGSELDSCVQVTLPRLVRNLGHAKTAVRRSAVQTLYSYMKQTQQTQHVFQSIVSDGLENEEKGLNHGYIMFSLQMLLTAEFDRENYFIIVQALARFLVVAQKDKQQAAFSTLEKIRRLVGEEGYGKYLDKLHPKLAKELERFSRNKSPSPPNEKIMDEEGGGSSDDGDDEEEDDDEEEEEDETTNEQEEDSPMEFGILPLSLMNKLNDEENWESRSHGVELLRQIVLGLTDVALLVPHLSTFLVLIGRLATDVNFKIVTVTLDIYRILIDKVKYRIRPHLHVVVISLSKHLADSKLAIRSGCIKALMQLMQCVSPTPVIVILTGNLQQKSSRLREETINVITAALLTFPSYEFDLVALCNAIAPMILDPKRKIRQAVLECLATLAQALGPTRSSVLIEIMEALQREHRGIHVVAATQARLARRILPRVTPDGLIEYSVQIPTSNGRRSGAYTPQGADVEWILAGAGSLSLGSASSRANSSDGRDISSGTSRSSFGGSFPGSPPTIRRIVSPGRGKSRLPWDDAKESPMRGRALSDDNVYTKSRRKPSPETYKNGRSTTSASNYSRRIELDSSWNRNRYNAPGSLQKQMYLHKLKHQNSRNGETVPFNTLGVSILPNKPKALLGNESRSTVNRRLTTRNLAVGDVNLSNTWPLEQSSPSPTPPLQRRRRKILMPIKGEETPVHTKPTIVRTTSAHKHRKVPPIGLAEKTKDNEDWTSSRSQSSSANTIEDVEINSWIHDEAQSNETVLTVSKNKETDEFRFSYNDIPFNSKPVLVRSPSLTKLRSSMENNNNNNEDDVEIDSLDDDIGLVGQKLLERNALNVTTRSIDSFKLQESFPILDVESLPIVQGTDVPDVRIHSVTPNSKSLEPDVFSSEYDRSVDGSVSDDEEEQPMAMSQTTRERILFKKQEMMKEAEKKRAEQKRQMEDELIEVTFTTNDEENDEIEIPKLRTPLPTKTPPSRSGSIKTHEKISPSSSPIITNSDLKPLPAPQSSLKEATQHLSGSEWSAKCDGLQLICRLAVHHPDVLIHDLHNLCAMILREVKNLRSSVSRAAIMCFGTLFTCLKKHMENDLDGICKVLLHKSGESSKFIQEDVEKTLMCMVEAISSQRAALAFIHGGANHKNASVRKLTSQLLSEVTFKMGAAKLFGSSKDLAEKILATAAHFVMDSSPFTRYNGRLIFHMLIFHPLFDSVLQKSLQQNVIRNIRNILDGIKSKGAGDKPNVRL